MTSDDGGGALAQPAARKRMLVIANPYATTVSSRLKSLVVYALQGRYEVDAVETEQPDHATELCRGAAAEGYDVVVAFGGDGTVNEAANGLAGSATPLAVLPGGATNVICRTLGVPNDVVDATEHLLALADRFEPRRIDLGRVEDRHFVFSSGVGLDASVVERVNRHPRLKSRFGEWYFAYAAVASFNRQYLVDPPRVRLEAAGRAVEGVTVIAQNSDPFTYFGRHPIRVCEGAGMDTGTLSMLALRTATVPELVTIAPRLFSQPSRLAKHSQVESFPGVSGGRVTATGERPFPVQVDGDYLGEFMEVDYMIVPDALWVVA